MRMQTPVVAVVFTLDGPAAVLAEQYNSTVLIRQSKGLQDSHVMSYCQQTRILQRHTIFSSSSLLALRGLFVLT